MTNITFNVSVKLAYYVAAIVSDASVLTAIAKVTEGKTQDDQCEITITDEDVIGIYAQLTVQPEGVSALNNDELEDILLPILGSDDYPDLALSITAIKQRNSDKRDELVTRGEQIIQKVQTSINNN